MTTEAQKRAKKKYQLKTERFTLEFYPPDAELFEHLGKQPKKQSYIKSLIRSDMAITKAAQSIELSEKEKIELFALTMFMDDEKKEAFTEYYKRQLYDKKEG